LVAKPFRAGRAEHRSVLGFHRRLRADLKEAAMIYVTALITALLFIYLGTALVRPEWF
jgi:F subunit of K+-transporting ATPase (Potass_KdpF)